MEALYEKCLRVLETAQSDTEKFAALLVVQKMLETGSIPPNFRSQVFKAIGSEFLNRLLSTDNVPEGCPPFIFKALAFSLLSALISDSNDTEVIDMIVHQFDVVKQILSPTSKTVEEEKILMDIIHCLNVAVKNDEARTSLITMNICGVLIENYLAGNFISDQSLELVLSVLSESPREVWQYSGQAIYRLMEKLTLCFSVSNAELFEINDLSLINIIIETHPIGHLDPVKDIGYETWLVCLRDGLFNLIKSKVFRVRSYREMVLNLAGGLTEKFGIAWLGLSHCNMADSDVRQFVAILVHVASIEICILFNDCEKHPDKLATNHTPVLLSCYNILECIITVTSDHIWEVIHEYTKQILDSINSAIGTIIAFLNEVSVFWDDLQHDEITHNFVIASIRLLCSWMAEETSALRIEICEVMPFILQLTRAALKDSSNLDGAELMRFLLPPLCHLSADNITRTVLMRHNIASLLLDYLESLWKEYDMELTHPSTDQEDNNERMVTICGIFLSLVVMEGPSIAKEETFYRLFKFLYNSLPHLSSLNVNLILQANFSVLGLLIARQFHNRLRACEVSFYRFLSSSIKFLWNAYDIQIEDGRSTLRLVKEYKAQWSDLKEMWFLGLQALTSLFDMVPWIGNFLLTSGWPDHIIKSLSEVGVEDIETSVKSAYQNFLCCLVKLCPDEFKPLQTILETSSKHNMKELESLLLAVDISDSQDLSVICA